MGIDALTGDASHEYLESATDPEVQTHPAYAQLDTKDIFWEFALEGAEIADLCGMLPQAFYKPAGFAYTVQRAWSNSAALASHDPCQPELPGEVYFNSVAVLPLANVRIEGAEYDTYAVTIPLHTTKTVEVDLYSDGPTSGPWSVQAVDAALLLGLSPNLTVSLNGKGGQNGDKLQLTIRADSAPTSGGAAGFALLSNLGAQGTISIGMVNVL
jgi:hypothetical protein